MSITTPLSPWQRIESLRLAHQSGYARALAEHLLGTDAVPDAHERLRLHHQLVELAPQSGAMFPNIAFTRLRGLAPDGWHITNPAIHASSPAPDVIARVVNYRSVDHRYHVTDRDGIVRTRLARIGWDREDAGTVAFRLLPDATASVDDDRFTVRGYEDVRPFTWHGGEYAVASIRNRNPAGVCQQYLIRLGADGIETGIPLTHPDDGNHKNWMPVVGRAQMTFVDLCSPLRVRSWDEAEATTTLVRDEPGHPLAREFRGGSCLVPIADGYLAVIHEVVHFGENRRHYVHRFVQFDADLTPGAVSDQFFFLKVGIEFAAGLRIEDGTVHVSFGVDDAAAWIAHIPLADVRASLRPIDERVAKPGEPPPAEPPADRHGIVSVTLTHDGREHALRDALASVVEHVDHCLVVNTGAQSAADDVAREIAGDKAIVVRHTWRNDFAEARNASLRLAAERTSAAWALICDSDERIHVDVPNLQAALDEFEPDVMSLNTTDRAQSYIKVRLFRLPTRARYVGTTHEYCNTHGTRQQDLPNVSFSERNKDEPENRHKADRDRAILETATRRSPMESRWWLYLGSCYSDIDRHRDAIRAFRHCIELSAWPEETAWAAYKAAQCWLALGRPDLAVGACGEGIGLHPGMAELPWFAAYASWQRQRWRDAISFANLAITHGEYVGLAAETNRISFRHFHALYEGPFDVLRFAYRQLGDTAAADQAEQDYRAAAALRAEHGR